ncbi:MAG: hypothetical protein PHS92_02390 [Candidatus Gracilibacteria bacterium]|nr:hypothetical protein [Candidatus Gracilibacteria bacterium]
MNKLRITPLTPYIRKCIENKDLKGIIEEEKHMEEILQALHNRRIQTDNDKNIIGEIIEMENHLQVVKEVKMNYDRIIGQ